MTSSRLAVWAGILLHAIATLQPAPAATLAVTSFQDAPDSSPGNGFCAAVSLPGAPCTLRAAIMEANANGESDMIELSAGVYVLSIAGIDENAAATGDLDITAAAAIRCLDCQAVIDGGGLDRVFDVRPGTFDVGFTNLTIRNGNATNSNAALDTFAGGAIRFLNGSDLFSEMHRCHLLDNRAGVGGAIYADGASPPDVFQLDVFDSEFVGNLVEGGAADAQGAAIYSRGHLVIASSSLHDNGSTVSGRLFGIGATIWHAERELQLLDSTVDGGSAQGIYKTNGNLSLRNVTITDNATSGVSWRSDGVVPATFWLRNSIIAGNAADGGSDCFLLPTAPSGLDNNGYNIDGGTDCNLSTADGNQSLVSLDAALGPLRRDLDLPARFPKPGGPASNAASPDTLGSTVSACGHYDQLGNSHLLGGRCDIGAVEYAGLFKNGFENFIIILPP